ncbi:phage major capsid protein [Methanobrevibacter sp.]|uniref:phage major capsid protein n=1 Tax=Methanobrevibacter sp. TaxID=66852 RepID=UPI003865AC35
MVNMNAILKSITTTNDTGASKSMREDMSAYGGILDREQFNQFMRDVEFNTTILRDAAYKKMNRENVITTGTLIEGRVLQDGYQEDSRETNANLTPAKIGFGKSELTAHKLKAKTFIDDDDLEDNIEGEQFQTTLLSMMGNQIGEDLEAIALFGDTDLDYDDQPLYHTYDGWIKQSTSFLKSSEVATGNSNGDFNVHDNTIEAVFDAIIRAVPARIRQSKLMSRFAIYVPYEVEDAYRNLLKSRNTQLGDDMQTGDKPLMYKKYPIKESPILEDEEAREILNYAPVVGGTPDLWKWGVYKDVKVEPKRLAELERTEFYYRTRCDVSLEWNSSFITAKLDLDEIELIQDEAKV